MSVDHVQLAVPHGGNDVEREFLTRRLGFVEVSRPEGLRDREGSWYVGGDIRIHVGVDADFHPAAKAHPALLVHDLDAFVVDRGLDIGWAHDVDGLRRGFVFDPFGNRIELIDAT